MTKFLTEKIAHYSELIAQAPEKTTADKKRKSEMLRHLANAENDCGAFGRIAELLSHSHGSGITRVRKQGQADTYIKINGKNYTAERKTNGGRIESLYNSSVRFVVYSLDLCNSTTKNKPRHLDPVILRTETFLEILETCGAIKSTNGTNPERAVQPSSLKMFNALLEYGTPYEPNKNYQPDEIN